MATSVSGSCSPNAFWRLRAFSFSHSTGRKKPSANSRSVNSGKHPSEAGRRGQQQGGAELHVEDLAGAQRQVGPLDQQRRVLPELEAAEHLLGRAREAHVHRDALASTSSSRLRFENSV